MALPPTPSGVVRIRCIHEQPNADHVGTHFDLAYTGSAPTSTDLGLIAGFGAAAWTAHLAALVNDNALLFEVTAVDLANPGTPQGSSPGPLAGTRTGNPVPNNIAAVISLSIDRRYRGSRPKGFWPFGSDSDMSSTTTWETSFVDAVVTAYNSFINAIVGQVAGGTTIGEPVGVSYYSGKHANPNPTARLAFLPTPRLVPALFAVVDTSMDTRFGSQRRRLSAA